MEKKFSAFLQWAKRKTNEYVEDISPSYDASSSAYCVQLVRQVNYGPQEFIKYFAPVNAGNEFAQSSERSLIEANFQKVNS